MRARIGYILFIFVFAMTMLTAPLVEMTMWFLQRTIQSFSIVGELAARGARLVANRTGLAEWKTAAQKAPREAGHN